MKDKPKMSTAKKVIIGLISAFVVFMLINYQMAFSASFDPAFAIWLPVLNPEMREVKRIYMKSLPQEKKWKAITIMIDGDNQDIWKQTYSKTELDKKWEAIASETDGDHEENLKQAYANSEHELKTYEDRLEKIGECELNGKKGHWAFFVKTFTFFNKSVDESYLTCNSGLKQ